MHRPARTEQHLHTLDVTLANRSGAGSDLSEVCEPTPPSLRAHLHKVSVPPSSISLDHPLA